MDDMEMKKYFPDRSNEDFKEIRRIATLKWKRYLSAVNTALEIAKKNEQREQRNQSMVW